MASPNASDPSGREVNHSNDSLVDIAQVYRDLARGEKTAETLESNLTSLEQKLDDILGSFENSVAIRQLDAQAQAKATTGGGKRSGEMEAGGGSVNGEDKKA